MRIRTTAAAAAAGLLLTLTACGSGNDDKPAAAPGKTVSQADHDAARKAVGLPAEPIPTARYAFLEALDAIDPRISKPGTDEQYVSRGLNQCGSIRTAKDEAELSALALERFTITSRFPEISNPETGKKIQDAVHKHLCPDF